MGTVQKIRDNWNELPVETRSKIVLYYSVAEGAFAGAFFDAVYQGALYHPSWAAVGSALHVGVIAAFIAIYNRRKEMPRAPWSTEKRQVELGQGNGGSK